MKLIYFTLMFPEMHLFNAYQTTSWRGTTSSHSDESDSDSSKPVQDQPYITPLHNSCSWTLRMPGGDLNQPAGFCSDSVAVLVPLICQALGCGGLYNLTQSSSPPNSSCLTSCSYHNHVLHNCSLVVSSDCITISEVHCGHQAVRLDGGRGRCAGRVELWRDGRWGTVCDDQWDLRDGDVVCGQLDCGYALEVSGPDGSTPLGSGPIYLDEVNCTGKERNLWECPATGEHDCGHKEDARVVCSEMRAVRLSGGLDGCSGKVEIHRNGSWGSVCYDCLEKLEAAMVCSMLGCGEPVQFIGFEPPFNTHNSGPVWYYICSKTHQNLWDCQEIADPAFCHQSYAAAVICNGSLGLPDLKTTTEAGPTSTTLTSTSQPPTGPGSSLLPPMSPLLLTCSVLSLLLVLLLISNTLLCCHNRRRRALEVQRRNSSLQASSEHRENDYRNSVDLVKITNVTTSNHAAGPSSEAFGGVASHHSFLSPDEDPPSDSFESTSSSEQCYENTGAEEERLLTAGAESSSEVEGPLYSPVSPDSPLSSESDYDDITNYPDHMTMVTC